MKSTYHLKKAYLVELSTWQRTIVRCVAVMIVMGLFIAYVTETALITPILFAGPLVLAGLAGNNGETSSGWSRLRLTMPLSRSDVVVARYALIGTLALIGVACGILTDGLFVLAASAGMLPENVAAGFLLTPESPLYTAAVVFASLAFAIVFASISIPVNIKLSGTSAIMVMAVIYMLILVGAFSIDTNQVIYQVLPFLQTSSGVTLLCAAALGISLVVMAVSLQISRTIYETFEF